MGKAILLTEAKSDGRNRKTAGINRFHLGRKDGKHGTLCAVISAEKDRLNRLFFLNTPAGNSMLSFV